MVKYLSGQLPLKERIIVLMKKSKVLSVAARGIGILLICVILVFLGYYIKDKLRLSKLEKQRIQYEEQAKINIEKYITEKYGFKPTIKASYGSYLVGDIFSSTYGAYDVDETVEVVCEYAGKTFYAVTKGNTDDISDAIDNYQQEEIAETFDKYLKENFDFPVIDYLLSYGQKIEGYGESNGHITERENNAYYLIHTKYDGTNLKEILGEYEGSTQYPQEGTHIEIITVCNSIEDIAETKLRPLFGNIMELKIFNMTTEEQARLLQNTVEQKSFGSSYDYTNYMIYDTDNDATWKYPQHPDSEYSAEIKEIVRFGLVYGNHSEYSKIDM